MPDGSFPYYATTEPGGYGLNFTLIEDEGKIEFTITTGTGGESTAPTGVLPTDRFLHFFAWWKSGEKIYLDVIELNGDVLYSVESVSPVTATIDYDHSEGGMGIYVSLYAALTISNITTWGRILSDSEKRQMMADPCCMMEKSNMPFCGVPAPAKGLWVVDSKIPQSINASGFAADGAFHVDINKFKEAEIHIDTLREDPAFIIHDASIKTGSIANPTDHLIGHWKCDDNEDNKIILDSTDKLGNMEYYEGSLDAPTKDISSIDAVRGRCLKLPPDTHNMLRYDPLPTSGAYDIANWYQRFTLCFKFKPNFTYDEDVGGVAVVELRDEGDYQESVTLFYRMNADSFRLWDNETSVDIYSDVYTSNIQLQQWHDFRIVCVRDGSSNMTWLYINDQLMGSGAFSDWEIQPTKLTFGDLIDGSYDDIRLYNEAILPYGTFIPGQITSGDVPYSEAHKDILVYVQGDETDTESLKIGLGDITVYEATHDTGPDGIANNAFLIDATSEQVYFPASNMGDTSQILISFWYKETGTVNNLGRFFEFDDGAVLLYRNISDTALGLELWGSSVAFGGLTNVYDGNWHFIQAFWDSTQPIREIYIDTILEAESSTSFTPVTPTGDFHIGNREDQDRECGGLIHAFTITNGLYASQIPFVLGQGPAHAPMIEKTTRVIPAPQPAPQPTESIPDPIAFYSFEDGVEGIDDSGEGNTLTEGGGTHVFDTTYYDLGAQSSYLTGSQYWTRNDNDLSSTFPGLSSTSNYEFTIATWFRITTNASADRVIAAKYDTDSSVRSFRVFIESTTERLAFQTGYNSGASYNTQVGHGTVIAEDTDYYVCVSLAADGITYRLRLYDANGDHLGTEITGTFANVMSCDTADFQIGAQEGTNMWRGMIDNFRVWDVALTADQMDEVIYVEALPV